MTGAPRIARPFGRFGAHGIRVAVLLVTVASAGCMRSRSHGRRLDATPLGSSSASPLASTSAALEPASGARPSAGPPTPLHYVEVSVGAVGPTPHGHVVLLLDPSKHRAVPIFIGESEAFSIKLRLAHRSYPRPLSHDLLETILHKLGGRVEQVRVERLVDNAYVATVVVVRDKDRFDLDARSSDAIALALGSQVPIFMAEEVLRSTAVELDRLPPITPPEHDDASPPEQPGVAM